MPNLAHSSHLSNIKRCEEHNLAAIRLNGVGGLSASPYNMVGLLTGVTDCGQTRSALCYVVDNPIAGDRSICLIGLRTLVDWALTSNITCMTPLTEDVHLFVC